MDRRRFLSSSAAASVAVTAACSGGERGATPAAESAPVLPVLAPADPGLVRVASVRTAVEGQLLPELIKRFEAASSYRVHLAATTGVYDLARMGQADVVVSHYGHRDAEDFVLAGLGEWPRTFCSNQMALLGPPADPAKVRGLHDLTEAFRRIAAARAPYVLNDTEGVRYLTEILWHAIGKPDRTGWVIDAHDVKDRAIQRASELGAYALWGLTPFMRLRGAQPLAVEPMLLDDPLLQRLMVSVIVKPGDDRRINVAGAAAFQSHLLEPATQAAILTIGYPGNDVHWTPAGRHNRSAVLPRT
jgi:tungstate transport system substrate-binding protein